MGKDSGEKTTTVAEALMLQKEDIKTCGERWPQFYPVCCYGIFTNIKKILIINFSNKRLPAILRYIYI